MSSDSDQVMIEVRNLTKRYPGGHTAIEDVSFQCKQGEVVGFLGPNGAGKTTTMRILTGYMPPTSGSAYIAGYHTLERSLDARQHLGYVPETVPLYPEMSVEGYLAFIGRIRRLDDLWEHVDDAMEAVGLLDQAEQHIGTLSKGMRQRVGLAQAILHDPEVLILDEPTIGLDPAQIREVRDLIQKIGEKHTILLSTHILSEVEQICNRVIMIFDGRLYEDRPMKRAADGGEAALQLRLAAADAGTEAALAAIPGVVQVAPGDGPGQYSLLVVDPPQTRQAVAALAVHQGWGLLELASERTSLEAIFMNRLRQAEQARLAQSQARASLEEEE